MHVDQLLIGYLYHLYSFLKLKGYYDFLISLCAFSGKIEKINLL